MEYILDNPLNSKCTIYTAGATDDFNLPTYSRNVVSCAIFEGKQSNIMSQGKEITSNTTIGLKVEPPTQGMVCLGESSEETPPSGSYEILKVSTARDVDQVIEGYWIWL